MADRERRKLRNRQSAKRCRLRKDFNLRLNRLVEGVRLLSMEERMPYAVALRQGAYVALDDPSYLALAS